MQSINLKYFCNADTKVMISKGNRSLCLTQKGRNPLQHAAMKEQMQGFRSTLCSYSSGERKLLEILENQGELWNKAAGKVFVGKGHNINVGKVGISHMGNRGTLWAWASSTHSHKPAFLHQLHCSKPLLSALVAHPEITIMHKFS